MKRPSLTIILATLLLAGCTQQPKQVQPQSRDNSNDTFKYVVEYTDETEEADDVWLPDFKAEHYDEWVVMSSATEIDAQEGEADFNAINAFVCAYMEKKGIALPTDAKERIALIDSICAERFDITEYSDGSNGGKSSAAFTRQLFDRYVAWLYEVEARKTLSQQRNINIDKEKRLMAALNDAMFNVCSGVCELMMGSGTWVTNLNVYEIPISFQQDLFKSVIGAEIEIRQTTDISSDAFDKECDMLVANFEPDLVAHPEIQDARPFVNRFKKAFHRWHNYRKAVAAQLKDEQFRKAYEKITYGYAHIHLLHLRNRFEDISMGAGIVSTKELLKYEYE